VQLGEQVPIDRPVRPHFGHGRFGGPEVGFGFRGGMGGRFRR
jgi:hypothetical protein